jgi:cytochrome c-type biogenesis protein CcmE
MTHADKMLSQRRSVTLRAATFAFLVCLMACRESCEGGPTGVMGVLTLNEICAGGIVLAVGTRPSLVGRVADGSLRASVDGSGVFFEMEPIPRHSPACAKHRRIGVRYVGTLPPLFAVGEEVIIRSRVTGVDEVIGTEMTTRCPGNYKPLQPVRIELEPGQ